MKHIYILLFSIVCSFFTLSASSSDSIKQANDLYAQGEYLLAAEQYENIISNQGVAPEIYYNLGNAYYKADETGRAILNYERALRLAPNYADAKHNLELAQLKVLDNVPAIETFFLMKWIENLIKLFSSNTWIYISVSLFVVAIILAFLFVFGNSHNLRKFSFYISLVLLVFTVATFAFSGVRKGQMLNHRDAIIMSAAITVKSSPDQSGTDLFQLHEGTKVLVNSTLGEWVEIKLGNGNVGWVQASAVERI